jgi:hypothetical protein
MTSNAAYNDCTIRVYALSISVSQADLHHATILQSCSAVSPRSDRMKGDLLTTFDGGLVRKKGVKGER